MLNRTIADTLKDYGLQNIYTVCDSAEQKSIMEIRQHGCKTIPCVKGKGSVKAGVQQVRQFKLHVTKRSADILDEADNYSYVKDEMTDTFTNEPIDNFNHAWDAIRYGVDFLIRKYRPKAAAQ